MSANYGSTIDFSDTESVQVNLARFEPSVSKGWWACTVTEQRASFSMLCMLLVLLGHRNTSNMDSMLQQACCSVRVHAPNPLETEPADFGLFERLSAVVEY